MQAILETASQCTDCATLNESDNWFTDGIDNDFHVLTPRPYQLDGITFLRRKQRAMIADAPGAGKTLQASEAARYSSSIMIVCPTYLTDQWFDFIHEQYPTDSISMASGTRKQRDAALNHNAKWTIVNTEMLRTYELPYKETVIIDESHHVRNREAAVSKAALEYCKHVHNVYLLTGTPIVKEADDYFMQLRIIDPNTFSSYARFVSTYCSFSMTSWGYQVTGVRNRALLKDLLSKYVMGRDYKDIGLQLPALIETIVPVRLTNEHYDMYKSIKNMYTYEDINFTNALQVLHALRMITSLAPEKQQRAIDMAAELPNCVVFTWYRQAARTIAAELSKLHPDAKVVHINGDTPPSERKELAQSAQYVVATMDSLSEGVDLSHIRSCVFFEEWYTYGVMHQALTRLQRYRPDGSEEPVNCYYVQARSTVDELIHQTQMRRTDTAVSVKDMIRKELARA